MLRPELARHGVLSYLPLWRFRAGRRRPPRPSPYRRIVTVRDTGSAAEGLPTSYTASNLA